MTDQMRMELLFAGVDDVERLQDGHGLFIDFCEWKDVECDENGEVISMNINNYSHVLRVMDTLLGTESSASDLGLSPGGSIDMQWLPPNAKSIAIHGLDLTGSLCTAALSESLRTLNISDNKLTGCVPLHEFPANIQIVKISSNDFTGSLDLLCLPKAINAFGAHINKFSGSLNFSALPNSLKYLDLSFNAFSGELKLPPTEGSLLNLNIGGNIFTESNLVVRAHWKNIESLVLPSVFREKLTDADGQVVVRPDFVRFDDENDPMEEVD